MEMYKVGLCEDGQPLYGETRWDGKKIVLRRGQSLEDWIDTLLHECLHGLNYDMYDESWVSDSATQLKNALIRCTPEIKAAVRADREEEKKWLKAKR